MFINGHEQSAVGVYWVSDGVDQCLVGFLHCHQVKHLNKLEGALCQVTEVYSDDSESPTKCHKHKKNFGCAIVAIVSSKEPNKVRKAKKTSQSPPETPTNLETPTNTNSKSPKQKRSIGSATEESRHKNRKSSVQVLQTVYIFSCRLFFITIREPRIWFMSPRISYMCFFYLIFHIDSPFCNQLSCWW